MRRRPVGARTIYPRTIKKGDRCTTAPNPRFEGMGSRRQRPTDRAYNRGRLLDTSDRGGETVKGWKERVEASSQTQQPRTIIG